MIEKYWRTDMDDKYALFKYQVISQVLNDESLNQTAYFKEMSEKDFKLEFTSRKKFSPMTMKKWLFLYRRDGFEGLRHFNRKDKGTSRIFTVELEKSIKDIAENHYFRTVKNLYEYLIKEEIITKNQLTYATLNNFVKMKNLLQDSVQKKVRKAYEVEHINQLWVCDFMYGPHVFCGKRKTASYLCAIIDDHSRLIVFASFYDNQSIIALENTLKNAILSYGIPNKFYCDNGKVFLETNLKLIAARLGFHLIHSEPHDSSSRGKIERYFRTVRDKFLNNFFIQHEKEHITLDLLNSSFHSWLHNDYNHHYHSTIKTTPFDRYLLDAENIKIRKSDRNSIEPVFYHTDFRKVNNDSTISFDNQLFQVQGKYIGKKIEIRYNPLKYPPLYLFENDKQVCQIELLDKHLNSKFPIKFHNEEK
jgi:transposase InsO family protein